MHTLIDHKISKQHSIPHSVAADSTTARGMTEEESKTSCSSVAGAVSKVEMFMQASRDERQAPVCVTFFTVVRAVVSSLRAVHAGRWWSWRWCDTYMQLYSVKASVQALLQNAVARCIRIVCCCQGNEAFWTARLNSVMNDLLMCEIAG